MPGPNTSLMNRIPEDLFNNGNLTVADELVAPDYIEHVKLPPGFSSGIAGLKQFVSQLRAAFPDFKYAIDLTVEEGDLVVQYVTAHGTMKGDLFGMPAANKPATWEEVHIARVRNGKLVEHWAVQDQLGMLQQLGFVPMPGQ